MGTVRSAAFLAVLGLVAGCEEPGTPNAPTQPSFAVGAPAACPASPTFVASDEAGLTAALGAAQAGDVVGLDGMIAVTSDVTIGSSITLTCVTPGSGLLVASGATVASLVRVLAPFVTVHGLTLDGTGTLGEPYLALNDPDDIDNDGVTGFATNVRLSNSTVTCGPGECAFFFATTNAVVSANRFQSAGSATGVHMQGGIDGVRVENNQIVATAPSTGPNFGGIRVRGGSNVIVAGNVVLGPWANSIAAAALAGSRVENNRLEGATHDAIRVFGSETIGITGNAVQCGGDSCFFADASPAVTIADNRFESGGSLTGVQLQNGIAGSRVERNTIVATAPSTIEPLGGIRVRDGSDVVVASNIVLGPWTNSLAPTNLVRSRFERNQLQGAQGYGIRMSAVVAGEPPPVTNSLLRSNRITAAGIAGVLAHLACANQFIGNDLQGNAGNMGAIFDETTGANVLVGNQTVVIDNGGGFDCNGDGVGDPNAIAGPGRVLRGVPFTPPPGVAAASSSQLR